MSSQTGTRPLRPSDLWSLPRVGPPCASVDGRTVVVPVTTSVDDDLVTRLWLVDGDGALRPLTTAERSSTAASVSPSGRHLAFLREHEGTRQLYVQAVDGGEAARVTDLPLGVGGRATWLPDEHAVVVPVTVASDDPTLEGTGAYVDQQRARRDTAHVTERRLYRFWDTWLTDATTMHLFRIDVRPAPDAQRDQPRDLTPDTAWRMLPALGDPGDSVAVSPVGDRVAWSAIVDGDDLPRYLLHVAPTDGSGPARCLTPDASANVSRPRFLPDGRILAGFQHELGFYASPYDLYAVDVSTGERAPVLVGWELQPAGWEVAVDGRVICATERDGRGMLYAIVDETATALPQRSPGRGRAASPGSLSAPVPAGDHVLALHSGLTSPPEVVRIDDTAVTPVTDLCGDLIAALDLGRIEQLTLPTDTDTDTDTALHVQLLHPPEATATARPPLVHMIHGGPHGLFPDAWSWRWNAVAFAARGYVVAMVNFHGSTSYGHAYTRSIHGDWATLPAADVHAATDALIEREVIDPERMAITGGSYGGFLTVWLAAHSDRFVCAVAHAAVTDFAGMWAGDWTYGWADALGGAPWLDLDATLRGSPAAHYADYTTPTLVIHGDGDYRVPVDQGLALYGVLKAKGVGARLVHFPDEHHWIEQKANSLVWYDEVLGWLDRHLSPSETI